MILICADANQGTLSRYESDNADPHARLTHRFEAPLPAGFNWAVVNEMRYAPMLKHRVAAEEHDTSPEHATLLLIEKINQFKRELLDPEIPA